MYFAHVSPSKVARKSSESPVSAACNNVNIVIVNTHGRTHGQDCARVTGSRNNYYRTRIGISRSKYLLERPSVSLRIGLAVDGGMCGDTGEWRVEIVDYFFGDNKL